LLQSWLQHRISPPRRREHVRRGGDDGMARTGCGSGGLVMLAGTATGARAASGPEDQDGPAGGEAMASPYGRRAAAFSNWAEKEIARAGHEGKPRSGVTAIEGLTPEAVGVITWRRVRVDRNLGQSAGNWKRRRSVLLSSSRPPRKRNLPAANARSQSKPKPPSWRRCCARSQM